MTNVLMLLAPAVMLGGAFMVGYAKKTDDRERRAKLFAAGQALWVIAAALAVVVVVGAVVQLTGEAQERTDIGDGIATIVVASLFVAACVCLLGYFGFWRAVARRVRAARSAGRERDAG